MSSFGSMPWSRIIWQHHMLVDGSILVALRQAQVRFPGVTLNIHSQKQSDVFILSFILFHVPLVCAVKDPSFQCNLSWLTNVCVYIEEQLFEIVWLIHFVLHPFRWSFRTKVSWCSNSRRSFSLIMNCLKEFGLDWWVFHSLCFLLSSNSTFCN